MSGWIKKGLERRKENLEAKLEKLEQDIKDRTDDVTDFRQWASTTSSLTNRTISRT